MSSGSRVFIVSSVIIVALIALTYFIKPATTEPTPPPAATLLKQDTPFVGVAPPHKPAPVPPTGAAGTAAPIAEVVPEPAEEPKDPAACEACRKSACTNYQGSGVNLLDGCYAQVNTDQGADPTDRRFLEDCQAAVTCAHEHNCISPQYGAATCFCGSAQIQDCLDHGPAADAPCVEQWQRATRSSNVSEIAKRFSDLKYPAGWASGLIECDVQQCKGKCAT